MKSIQKNDINAFVSLFFQFNSTRLITSDELIQDYAVSENASELKIDGCKEVLGYGRSVGIPVFEYLDSINFTQRKINSRVLVDLDIVQ